ncbi:MAG: hypothetical protein EYC70_02610 [Planctomycetota bacterium]|nr:MAG: hypothetical protein EYC70_02610 [Planctomycetota bacterium]
MDTSSPAPQPLTWKGVCHLLFQYDVGQNIDLQRCRGLIAAQPALIQQEHRAPSWFQFNPPPLQVLQESPPAQFGAWRTAPRVSVLLYDFGAISIGYDVPFAGTLAQLTELSCSLQESHGLWETSRGHVQQVLEAVRSAVSKPGLADLTEDYVIFQMEEPDPPISLTELPKAYARELAQVLRGERESLSGEEVFEAVGSRVSYGPDDLTLVDWQAALLIGKGMGDVKAVLEFASVQLLEMRFLDRKLDEALDRSYETLASRSRIWLRSTSTELLRVGQMQVDAAILHERVINALKLLGDQYLARVYQLASRQFRLSEWNTTLLRKIETLESIYEKLNDQGQTKRMEILELIIIVLILISIVLPFLGLH